MADPQVRISIGDSGANEDDVEMQQEDSPDVVEVGETGAGGDVVEQEEGIPMEDDKPAQKLRFVEYVARNGCEGHMQRSRLRLLAAI